LPGLSFAVLEQLLSPLYPILTSCNDRSMVKRVEEEVMEALYNIAKESQSTRSSDGKQQQKHSAPLPVSHRLRTAVLFL
jgi:hypothetical protein